VMEAASEADIVNWFACGRRCAARGLCGAITTLRAFTKS